MAFTFGFYNALNHDRRYNAIQVSSIFDGIVRDGVFMSIGGHMNVQATGNGFNIVVESGRAWFNHTWSLLDADYPMVVEPSDVLEDRIDAVVLEVNENVDVRLNSIKIIKGEPAAKPAKPALTNNLDVHQYPLAYITVPANSVTLTQSNVENAVGTSATPFVTGILETIEIDDLIAQWKSQWNDWTEEVDLNWNNWFETTENAWEQWLASTNSEWRDEMQDRLDEYQKWFDRITATLDDDAATQLAKEVIELQDRDEVIRTYTHQKTGTVHKFTGKGSNGKVKMTANVSAGDTVQIVFDGAAAKTVPAYYGTESFADALSGEAVNGKWLSFTYDGSQINFKGGGGVGVSKLTAATAVPADVVSGKTFYSKDKNVKTGTLREAPGVTDASSLSLYNDHIYYRFPFGAYRTRSGQDGCSEVRAPQNSVIGALPGGNRGNWNGTYSGSNVTIPQGYHAGGGSVGVAGGNRGAWGTTINPGGSVTIPQGYHSGGGVVRANGGGSWPLRHMGFNGSNQLETYSVGAPDGEGTYVWVFEGIVSWGNANSGLEFHFFENNFGPVYGERNSHITSGKNYFTSGTTVQVRYWGGFADLWYIRIA